jgi:hypothetical protein
MNKPTSDEEQDQIDTQGRIESRQEFELDFLMKDSINKGKGRAVVYDLLSDYTFDNDGYIAPSPGWCLAVYRLGKPITYTRLYAKSSGETITGAFERSSKPLIHK